MKQLDTEQLDATLYVDRAKRVAYSAGLDDNGQQVKFTLRSYLVFILDLPVNGKAMTVSRLNSINRCVATLTDPECGDKIEDAHFEFLKQFIEDRAIELPLVYQAANTLIATAR